MKPMFCQLCGMEMVKEQRVVGDPALDCGGDCAGCLDEIEEQTINEERVKRRIPVKRVINRRAFPDIYDDIALVYGWATAPMDDMPNRIDATDLLPLGHTPDGTPI